MSLRRREGAVRRQREGKRQKPRGRGAARRAGRADTSLVPMYVRAHGMALDEEARSYIRRKLEAKLRKFATALQRVSVRVEDVNGPRGGVDRVCRIKVVVRGLPSVVFQHQDAALRAAMNGAVQGIERAVRRSLQRRRMNPMTGRVRRTRPVPGGVE